MKPFDLEAAKRGEPLITRDGRPAWFIGEIPDCVNPVCPVVAYINDSPVIPFVYRSNGMQLRDEETEFDLFMAPDKKTRWLTVWSYAESCRGYASLLSDTKNDAINLADRMQKDGKRVLIEAMPIEWEE